MKYRKKPVVVEAFHAKKPGIYYSLVRYIETEGQNDGLNQATHKDAGQIPDWLTKACDDEIVFLNYKKMIKDDTIDLPTISIKTLEGNHDVSQNDFIIKGVKGELYPCKPDIFRETYERAE